MLKQPIPALVERTVRGILFDLGHTLWFPKDASTWQRLEQTANLRAVALLRQLIPSSSLPTHAEDVQGELLRKALMEHMHNMVHLEPALEPNGGQAVVQVLRQWGIEDVDRQHGEAIFEQLNIRIPESRTLFADAIPTLQVLRRRGFQLGIVSNRYWGGESFQEDLQIMGLLECIEPRHMAISADLGIRKPNPAIFLHTLNALDIPPTQAVMVGDSLSSDIAGAQSLNMFAVWKPKPGLSPEARPRHREIRPDLIIENLHELLDIFVKVGEQ